MRGFNKLNVSVLTSQLTDILLMPSWINKEIGLHLFCQHKTMKQALIIKACFSLPCGCNAFDRLIRYVRSGPQCINSVFC